jgi:hypothetical protein
MAPASATLGGDMIQSMISFVDVLPPALVGATFTLLGSLKLFGLAKGVVGGADKSIVTQLCGT